MNSTLSEDNQHKLSAANSGTHFVLIIIIISWYIYGKYTYLSLRGMIRYRNFNFIFTFIAALFAFANNTNDIVFFVYPMNCRIFGYIFTISATLNWAPISWLQAYRLILIAKIYLSKASFYIISLMAIAFSATYCTFYFLNLSKFGFVAHDIMGCAATNSGKYSLSVMLFDIIDSVFSLATLCILVYRSINNLKELNTRNQRLNDLVGQGIIELIIIAVAKIIIYPTIKLTSTMPGGDVFWDILSIIVIISGFKMVNFPYEKSDFERSRNNNLRRKVFNFIDSGRGPSNNSTSTNNNSTYSSKYPPIETSTGYNSPIKKDKYSPTFSYNSSTTSSTLFNSNLNLSDPKAYKPILKNEMFNNSNYNYKNMNNINNTAFNANAAAYNANYNSLKRDKANAQAAYTASYNSLKRENQSRIGYNNSNVTDKTYNV